MDIRELLVESIQKISLPDTNLEVFRIPSSYQLKIGGNSHRKESSYALLARMRLSPNLSYHELPINWFETEMLLTLEQTLKPFSVVGYSLDFEAKLETDWRLDCYIEVNTIEVNHTYHAN